MDLRKLVWAFRGLVYKVFFGEFGRMSYMGRPISLIGEKNIFVKERVRIYPGNRMETYRGGRIIIDENTSIAQNFHVIAEKEDLIIGKNVTISGNVFVTNIDHEYKDIEKHILDQKWSISTTKIGDGCFIGFGAAIQAGTILGKHCIVGANSVVRGSFPDYCVIVGAPGKIVKRYNPYSKEWERV